MTTSTPADFAAVLQAREADGADREAVRCGEQSWTWREFNDRVRRNAGAQRAAGLVPGDRVAFLDKNHPACLETTLGCVLAGTAHAVVNFRLAPAEIAYVVNDSAARVLLVGAEFLPVVEQVRAQLHLVEHVVVVGPSGANQVVRLRLVDPERQSRHDTAPLGRRQPHTTARPTHAAKSRWPRPDPAVSNTAPVG